MIKRNVPLLAVLFGACLAWGSAVSAATARPNIVLILADDMGYSDLGCYGGEIETPNLDRLAGDGLRFMDFHNAARCCPTRASLLTGLYPHEAGVGHMVYRNQGEGYLGHLNDRCTTLAQVLGKAGYHTMMAGKWHVGHQDKSVQPEQRGFRRFYGTYLHVDSYFKVLPGCDIWLNGEKQIPGDWKTIPKNPTDSDKEFYTTDVYTDFALRFLDESYAQEKPFFLYLAYNAPHWPLEAPERIIAKYRERYDGGWDQLRKEKFARMKTTGIVSANAALPPSGNTPWVEVSEADRRELAFRRAIYAAQIDSMDENIGRVVASLRRAGRLGNTLLLFLSDNGCSAEQGMFGYNFEKNRIATYDQWRTASGRSASQGQAWANVSNVPYRKYKKYTHEGGCRTPLIAHWPAGIKDGGTLRRDAGHIIDVMATVCELAGAERPSGTRGCSLVPTFEGKPVSGRDAIYWEHEGHRAIRVGDWKLVSTRVEGGPGPWELYNLAGDATETRDLVSQFPDRVEDLEERWTAWAREANVLPDQFERRTAPKKRAPKVPRVELTVDGRKLRLANRGVKRQGEAWVFDGRSWLELDRAHAPHVAGKRTIRVSGSFTARSGNGVILAHGGNRHGFAVYLEDGCLVWTQVSDWKRTLVSSEALAACRHSFEAVRDANGRLSLQVDGRAIATAAGPVLVTEPGDSLQVGADTVQPVGEYDVPNPFKGTLHKIEVRCGT